MPSNRSAGLEARRRTGVTASRRFTYVNAPSSPRDSCQGGVTEPQSLPQLTFDRNLRANPGTPGGLRGRRWGGRRRVRGRRPPRPRARGWPRGSCGRGRRGAGGSPPVTVAVRPNRPQGRGPPLAGRGGVFALALVGEVGAQVVQQEIRIGVDGLVAQLDQRVVGARLHGGDVASGAAQRREERGPALRAGVGQLARGGTPSARM